MSQQSSSTDINYKNDDNLVMEQEIDETNDDNLTVLNEWRRAYKAIYGGRSPDAAAWLDAPAFIKDQMPKTKERNAMVAPANRRQARLKRPMSTDLSVITTTTLSHHRVAVIDHVSNDNEHPCQPDDIDSLSPTKATFAGLCPVLRRRSPRKHALMSATDSPKKPMQFTATIGVHSTRKNLFSALVVDDDVDDDDRVQDPADDDNVEMFAGASVGKCIKRKVRTDTNYLKLNMRKKSFAPRSGGVGKKSAMYAASRRRKYWRNSASTGKK